MSNLRYQIDKGPGLCMPGTWQNTCAGCKRVAAKSLPLQPTIDPMPDRGCRLLSPIRACSEHIYNEGSWKPNRAEATDVIQVASSQAPKLLKDSPKFRTRVEVT